MSNHEYHFLREQYPDLLLLGRAGGHGGVGAFFSPEKTGRFCSETVDEQSGAFGSGYRDGENRLSHAAGIILRICGIKRIGGFSLPELPVIVAMDQPLS